MKKSLYDISWKVSEEEYRQDPAFSYSTLARFNREGFAKLDKLYDKVESPSLLFGSIVDTLLTGSKEEFDNNYIVAELPNISDSLVQITKILYNNYSTIYNKLSLIPDSIIADVGEQCNYYSSAKYTSYRIKQVRENCNEYYNLLFLTEGKKLVSTTDYQDAVDCVDTLKNHKYTKWYFADNNPFDDTERLYQLKFKGTYNNINLRSMADLIIVCHDTKKVIPCDLKTSGKPEYDFFKSFIDWSYHIQARLYWYLIRQLMDTDEYYKDFELCNYRFIVINRYNKTPLVWEYNDTTKIGDLYYKDNNILCKDWRNIAQDLQYYTNNPDIKYPIGIKEINDITYWLNK